MGFFNGIKRALGFSENGDEHDDELDGIDGRAARSPYVNPFKNDKPVATSLRHSLLRHSMRRHWKFGPTLTDL